MPHTDPHAVSRAVLGGVTRAGVRAVIGSGWAGVGTQDPVPDGCLVVDGVNHTRLFPRVAAVVHHGGAGTTSTAARCGVPQLLVPHLLDQFYWSHRVHAQGLGPRPLPIKRLDATTLAEALRSVVGNASYRDRAREV